MQQFFLIDLIYPPPVSIVTKCDAKLVPPPASSAKNKISLSLFSWVREEISVFGQNIKYCQIFQVEMTKFTCPICVCLIRGTFFAVHGLYAAGNSRAR